MLVTLNGPVKSARVLRLPDGTGTLVSIRMIAFEMDGEPIAAFPLELEPDDQPVEGQLLVEMQIVAAGVLLHKDVVSRLNVSLQGRSIRHRTLFFGRYPSVLTAQGTLTRVNQRRDRSGEPILTLQAPTLLYADDPTLQNDIPYIIKAELAILRRFTNAAETTPSEVA